MDAFEHLYYITTGNRCFLKVYDEVIEILKFHVEPSEKEKENIESFEEQLLKLTVVHRLFQRQCHGEETCGKLIDVCNALVKNDLIKEVISCMESPNQHVVFMASKAISSVLLSLPCLMKENKLQGLFLESSGKSEWKSLYGMEILCQLVIGCHSDQSGMHGRATSGTPSCGCASSTFGLFPHKNHSKKEILDYFICTQGWGTILPFFFSFWSEICGKFMQLCKDSTELENGQARISAFNELHAKLSLNIHANLPQELFKISGKVEQTFLSFLQFLSQYYKQESSNLKNRFEVCEDGACSIETGTTHTRKTILLQRIPALVHIFHMRNLSSEVWTSIVHILRLVLVNNETVLQNNQACRHVASGVILHIAVAVSCAVNCCVLDNIPVHLGIEGFGGDLMTPNENDTRSKPNIGVFCHTSLLVMRASLILLNYSQAHKNMNDCGSIFQCINTWYDKFLSNLANKLGPVDTSDELSDIKQCKIILEVFADQDDEMIEMLLLLLKLHKWFTRGPIKEAPIAITVFNPHLLFLSFLSLLQFDHSLLLDFLISSETAFLEYMTEYLHLVQHEWEEFCLSNKKLEGVETEAARGITGNENAEERNRSRSFTLPNDTTKKPEKGVAISQEGTGRLSLDVADVGLGCLSDILFAYKSDSEDENDSGNSLEIKENVEDNINGDDGGGNDDDLGDDDNGEYDEYDGNDDDDGNNGDDLGGDKGGEDGAGSDDDFQGWTTSTDIQVDSRNNSSNIHYNSNTPNESPMLERTMSTLIHTRIIARRLSEGGLFPYRAEPLLRLMEKIENLYDGC